MNTLEILNGITQERMRKERDMMFRHPWVPILYNYLIAGLLIALTVSIYGWALNVWADARAKEKSAADLAAYQAEQQATEDARLKELAAAQASEDAIIKREATAIAKAFYGIRNFVEKYHYSDEDLTTYARCVFNRVDASKGLNSVEVIVSTPEQFLAYADGNPVLSEFYEIAQDAVTEWHNETVRPCDISYRYAELTEQGIYLVSEFGADGYARRWHA